MLNFSNFNMLTEYFGGKNPKRNSMKNNDF